MSVKQNLFVSVFVHKCLMTLDDVEYTIFKMFVTQLSNYLFVISFQLMFIKHCVIVWPESIEKVAPLDIQSIDFFPNTTSAPSNSPQNGKNSLGIDKSLMGY